MRILHVGFGFRPLRWGGLIMYVEDLMDAQIRRGHDVGYFHGGRAYPFLPKPRLRESERAGIKRWEVVNPPVVVGGGYGTAYPAAELDEPVADAMFARVLDEFAPDVVHVQEMLGLPTSIWSVAKRAGVPIVLTMHDYGVLCPTLKLYDAEGEICRRREPGEMCVVCCRNAPTQQRGLMDDTVFFEQTRFLDWSGLHRVPRPRAAVDAYRRTSNRALQWWRDRGHAAPDVGEPATPELNPHATPAAYDERRRVNVERLNGLDRVLAISQRVYDINRDFGVSEDVLRRVHIAATHIADIPAQEVRSVEGPVRFVTLASCASREKGTDVILGALETLSARGLGPDDYTLSIYGSIEDRVRDALPRFPAARWAGFYGPEEMARVLHGEHVGIVPSVWEECYGFVGVEMLAAGLPVIGNARGGITDYVIDGQTGWRNKTADGDGLAAIMAAIVRDPAQVPALSRQVLAHRDELVVSMDDHVLAMDAVYGELLPVGATA